jgi:hypothetical protein
MPSETPKKSSNVIEMKRDKKPKPTTGTDVDNSHGLDDVDQDVRRNVETGEENAT